MRIITSITFSLFTSILFSQEKENIEIKSKANDKKNIDYFVVRDNPRDLKIGSLTIPIWNATGSLLNSSLYDLNLMGTYHKERFHGNLKYRFSLLDRMFPESFEFGDYPNHPYVFSVNKVKNAQDVDAVGTYFLYFRQKKGEEPIPLRSAGNITYYTIVPVTYLYKMGVNLGYAQGFSWYNMNFMKLNYEFNDLPGIVRKDETFGSMGTVQTFKFIKTGLTFTKAYDFTGNFDGYGERTNGEITTTFFNLLFAVQNEFDDVYVPVFESNQEWFNGGGGQYVSRASINDQNKKLNIVWMPTCVDKSRNTFQK